MDLERARWLIREMSSLPLRYRRLDAADETQRTIGSKCKSVKISARGEQKA